MLTELPVLVVDALLGKYVSHNDLRAIHQVSKGWKQLIDQRPLVNAIRLALVSRIREQKENIQKSTQPLELPVLVTAPKSIEEPKTKGSEDKKADTGSGRVLRPLSGNNEILTPAQRPNSHGRSGLGSGNPHVPRISSTPKTRFLRRYEAGLNLIKGQVLFSCPDCKSPVPSPVPSYFKEEKRRGTALITNKSSDSGFSFGLSPSIEESQIPKERYTQDSIGFDSINISMIATPPYSPYFENSKSEDIHTSQLQQTRSPSCPFLTSTSSVSIFTTGSSDDSGVSSSQCQDYSKAQSWCSSPTELLRFHYAKQLKLKSSSSPSLLLSKEEHSQKSKMNNNQSPVLASEYESLAIIVECPDCACRFCSRCELREHTGKPCHLIGEIEDDETKEYLNLNLPPPRPTTRSRPRPGTTSKAAKKASLRRLAYL